jgi:hypothetical protein
LFATKGKKERMFPLQQLSYCRCGWQLETHVREGREGIENKTINSVNERNGKRKRESKKYQESIGYVNTRERRPCERERERERERKAPRDTYRILLGGIWIPSASSVALFLPS